LVRNLAQVQETEVARTGGEHVLPLLERVEELLVTVAAGRSGPLSQHASATIAAGGKRLRPLLVILTGAGDRSESLVRAAAAVELVHSATLVHDDVLDAAPLRRGRPTVFESAGREAATQTGDLIFARAFTLVASNDDPEQVQILSDASSALARGELLQRADAWNAAISVERYLERCDLKTARLFQAAARLGARNGAGDGTALGGFGRSIGLAFQILDDVLDVSGPAEKTGKHRGTDLLDGTVTLPFILARELDESLAALDPREITTPQQAEAVCDRIAATGALAAARERALEYVAQAKALLPADLDANEHAALTLVADGVVARFA
jgi:geranylgeranyl pyrophosphate synthase